MLQEAPIERRSRAMTRQTTEVTAPSHRLADAHLDGLSITAGSTATHASRVWQLTFGSLLLHASAVAALLVLPLLREGAMPPPTHTIDAFFAAPSVPAPPPPPPALAAAAHSAAAPHPTRDTQAFVAPIEIPDAIEEAGTDLDLGIEGGQAGGVEGGVAGGVVGGIVGGALGPPSPPKVLRVGGAITEPRKLLHVNPIYPQVARVARVQGRVVIDCLIDPGGHVVKAHVVEGAPLLKEAALEAVRQWRYTPTLYGGVPVPLEMRVTVSFRLS